MTLNERMALANTLLAPYATPHQGGLGRIHEEEPDETRFPFQRDRDRIIHSYSFRRMAGKTQVFIAGQGDHFRTRLTHSMEVAQISRDLARTLRLNEDLSECIALAHDLGHPPFGHAGQDTMDAWMKEHGLSFEHNLQSYRIATLLEQHSTAYPGLNLNREILQGLLKHSATDIETGLPIRHGREAQLVNIADAIAYTAHDCDDGLTAGLFTLDDVLAIPLAAEAYERTKKKGTFIRGALLHLLITDLVRTSEPLLATEEKMRFSDGMLLALKDMRSFLWNGMYMHPSVLEKAAQGQAAVDRLLRAYEKDPPEKVLATQKRTSGTLLEAVKDYVAGMTDTYALHMASRIA